MRSKKSFPKKSFRSSRRRKPKFVKKTALRKVGSATINKRSKLTTISYHPRYGRFPLPDRFMTTLWTRYDANGSATGVPVASNYFDVKMNSAYHPFNATGAPSFKLINNTGNYPDQFPGQTAMTTLAPAGYSSLFNTNLYNEFYVMKATLTLEFDITGLTAVTVTGATQNAVATNVGEITVVILPYAYQGTSAPPTTIGAAMLYPHAVTKIVKSVGRHKISCTVTPAQILGVPEKAIEYDVSGDNSGFYNADPASKMHFRVLWCNSEGQTRGSSDSIHATLTQHVIATTLNPQTLTN